LSFAARDDPMKRGGFGIAASGPFAKRFKSSGTIDG
jgi:hypothetical protein